jgi:hypothetical protein
LTEDAEVRGFISAKNSACESLVCLAVHTELHREGLIGYNPPVRPKPR